MSRSWIYHPAKEAKIIDNSELPDYIEDGWAESPADFETPEYLELEDMTPAQLSKFALDLFGVKLDSKLNKEMRIKKITELMTQKESEK